MHRASPVDPEASHLLRLWLPKVMVTPPRQEDTQNPLGQAARRDQEPADWLGWDRDGPLWSGTKEVTVVTWWPPMELSVDMVREKGREEVR